MGKGMRKPFGRSICTICKKRFGNKNSLRKHREATGHKTVTPSSKAKPGVDETFRYA